MTSMNRPKRVQRSDPGKVMDLIISLEDDACSKLQTKINAYLSEECEAELVFGVVVNIDRAEAYIETVGKEVLGKKKKLLDCQKFINIMKKSYQRKMEFIEFYDDVQTIVTPYLKDSTNSKRHVTLVPVVSKPFALLVCLVSPKVQEEHVVDYVYECFLPCWPTVKKTIQLENETSVKFKCQHLLRVAKRLFTQVNCRESLVKLATDQGKRVVDAELCALMIIDLDRMELVETGFSKDTDETFERWFPMDRGIVGQVLRTGTIVNSRDPTEHPAYDPGVDSRPGIDPKTSLTFPIREQQGIIGVGLVINKIGDPYFDAMDEEMALSFSVYCGMCITHSVMYMKMQEASVRNVLAHELAMYHIEVNDTEVSKVMDCKGFHNIPDLTSLFFNTRGLAFRELPCLVVKMFNDLGLIRKFNLKKSKLVRFVLQVRKSYRDVPYHNWYHAFSVTQWGYAALSTFQLVKQGYFTDLQALMYLIACLVHDLDHRGSPCSYHINGEIALAALYSSEGSVLERHHLGQALCILNTEGCDILEPLSRRDYDRALLLLRDFVLATDLNHYFRKMTEYKLITSDYLIGNYTHIAALQALLMNAADFSDQIKGWSSVKKTAAEVLTEFFNQDEVEKDRKDLPPVFPNQTNKTIIPELEIQFINDTIIPLYQMLGKVFPVIDPAIDILEGYLVLWDGAKDVFIEVSPVVAGLSVLLSPELDELIQAALDERERLRLEAEALAAEQAAAAAALAAAAAQEED